MSLKEQIVSSWAKVVTFVREKAQQGWSLVAEKLKAADSMCSSLVSTEPGFEISKRVISSMPQAAITVIAIQMAMVGAGIGMVGITVLISVFCVSAIWATKARNEAIVAKA
jgi:hypothetical protein